MRKIILERLSTVWCDDMEITFDITMEEAVKLSDENLLDLYDEVFGYVKGEV